MLKDPKGFTKEERKITFFSFPPCLTGWDAKKKLIRKEGTVKNLKNGEGVPVFSNAG